MSLFREAFTKSEKGLQDIVDAYRRNEPSDDKNTIIEYANGDISSLNIVGELTYNSIPVKENIVKVNVGKAVSSIGSGAFDTVASLQSVTIPDSVTNIKNWAFIRCSSLSVVELPTTLSSIGQSAFESCTSLQSIVIPKSVTNIGEGIFIYCPSLSSITVDSYNVVYDSRNNCNGIVKTANNEMIAGCKNTTIPNTVTSIGKFAFSNCTSLQEIAVPDSVVTIKSGAFQDCTSLQRISFNEVTSISDSVFLRCSSLHTVGLGNSIAYIGGAAFAGCASLSCIVSLASSAPNVSDYTFGTSDYEYTGRNTYSSGNNVLKVPQGATGYDSRAWLNPLQNASKCGFHVEYIV